MGKYHHCPPPPKEYIAPIRNKRRIKAPDFSDLKHQNPEQKFKETLTLQIEQLIANRAALFSGTPDSSRTLHGISTDTDVWETLPEVQRYF